MDQGWDSAKAFVEAFSTATKLRQRLVLGLHCKYHKKQPLPLLVIDGAFLDRFLGDYRPGSGERHCAAGVREGRSSRAGAVTTQVIARESNVFWVVSLDR